MEPERYTWRTRDGLALRAEAWRPEGALKGAVAVVHGLGEHMGRYAHVAKRFSQAGFLVNLFDQRGHGGSEGPRLYAPSYEHIMQDIDAHLEQTRTRAAGAPVFLYGHSLGGNQVLYYCLVRRPRLAGVIASSPALGSRVPQPPAKVLLGRILNRVIPTLAFPTGYGRGDLSHDPAITETVKADPYYLEGVSIRLGLDLLRAGEWIRSQKEFPLPLLIQQGTGDRVVEPSLSVQFAKGLSGDVTLKLWEGLYHELHNEVEKDKVFDFMLEWLEQHLGAR